MFERIEPRATREDLALPAEQMEVLSAIVARARREPVDAGSSLRAPGFAVLFSGPSGTGKTLAAEVLARELGVGLCRVDLGAVVSRFVGETEKNLARVFDLTEEGAAVLLFDEADALFGKRTDVGDGHDRFANPEISYLLERLESYRGLAVLTSNRRNELDSAFLRCLRFIVEFPSSG